MLNFATNSRGETRPEAVFGSAACAAECGLRIEADHRIANHLTLLSALVQMKGREVSGEGPAPSREDVRRLVQSLDGQIRAVARLHRLMVSSEPDAPVDLAGLLHEVCAPFAGGMDRRAAIVQHLSPGCFVAPDQVMPISQIVSEAITNAMKHAGSADGFGVISVRCRGGARGGPVVEVCDDGEGLPAGFDPASDGGFGLNLIRGLSRALGASLAFDDARPGVRIRLSLPRGA
jgi:two-component sensor histidine kinase